MAVIRIEVRPVHSIDDPAGNGVLAEIKALGIASVTEARTTRVFFLEADAAVLTPDHLNRIGGEVLIDPVTEQFTIGVEPAPEGSRLVEVHLKPGVMDPVAESCQSAIADLLDVAVGAVEVRTGRKIVLFGSVTDAEIQTIAKRLLVNESIETGHFEAFLPSEFPKGHTYEFKLIHVPIRHLTDEQLLELSRRGHLFLDLPEMQAIQNYFRSLDRDPTDAELETLAQTWSEHCVHKTLKAKVELTYNDRRSEGRVTDAANAEVSSFQFPVSRNEGEPLSTQSSSHGSGNWKLETGNSPHIIDNLVKSTIFKATQDLNKPWTLSVFKDNAGVIEFDEDNAVCFKVETHNRPSAIEPYGGAATGIGGVIRDVMGTGLGAKPIANTDIFCFADPNTPLDSLPNGVIHPRRSAQRVVAGVRDYGNRMGIPTVNGAVFFDQRYIGNPLVFCGTVGVMPKQFAQKGQAIAGDHIVVIGGRTGRDGIHGATFSSDVVTTSHADEFSHAVQIGNAITEKKTLDVILKARDLPLPDPNDQLYHAITDCGAGGLSSAIGEMGEHTGATVELHKVPLKYAGLSYPEIWISEAQERMVVAVPPRHVQTILDLCASENVEATDIGIFDGSGKLTLRYHEHTVAHIDMSFIHDGIPKPLRKAVYTPPTLSEPLLTAPDYAATLVKLLAMPTIASKHWIIRQYDHEVQGGTVVKPLVGPQQDGPSDAAVIRPLLASHKGVALAVGCQPSFGDLDPYHMALNAIDEALRNLVCVGGDPQRTAILDNFCWPKCSDPQHLGALVLACQACYDGAMAYQTPFISGKDSLSNEFITDKGERIQIPYTLLISAMGLLDDVRHALTMDAKAPGNHLVLVGLTKRELGGSRYLQLRGHIGASVPQVDLATAPKTLQAIHQLIKNGLVRSAHDLSEGGLAVALAEMLFAGNLGASIDLAGVPCSDDADADDVLLFSESPTRILLEVEPRHFDALAKTLQAASIRFGLLGVITPAPQLKIRSSRSATLLDLPLETLKQAWIKPLDW